MSRLNAEQIRLASRKTRGAVYALALAAPLVLAPLAHAGRMSG